MTNKVGTMEQRIKELKGTLQNTRINIACPGCSKLFNIAMKTFEIIASQQEEIAQLKDDNLHLNEFIVEKGGEIEKLKEDQQDYVEANESRQEMARLLGKALGHDAKQPSLCDLVKVAEQVKEENRLLYNILQDYKYDLPDADYDDVCRILSQINTNKTSS